MKSIKLGFFTVLEFEESNTNYDCIRQIMQAKDRQIIGQTDFDIICSMFELHKKLPPVAKVLYDNGFVLPKNEIVPGYSHDAVWKYEQQNEPLKIFKYSDKYNETKDHQSDSYYKLSEYRVGDLLAKCECSILMSNYGKNKKNQKNCTITANNKFILEHTINENE
jgi:hypothetical protein